MVGGITQRWINTKLQFCWSNNLETFCKIYLRLISVSFPHFQIIVCFLKSPFGVTSSVLMKSSFSQNQIFNEKWNSCINSFLVLCLEPFVADITFIIWWNRAETNVSSKLSLCFNLTIIRPILSAPCRRLFVISDVSAAILQIAPLSFWKWPLGIIVTFWIKFFLQLKWV